LFWPLFLWFTFVCALWFLQDGLDLNFNTAALASLNWFLRNVSLLRFLLGFDFVSDRGRLIKPHILLDFLVCLYRVGFRFTIDFLRFLLLLSLVAESFLV